MARTGCAGPKGISCFVVDKDTPNMTFDGKEQKVSVRNFFQLISTFFLFYFYS